MKVWLVLALLVGIVCFTRADGRPQLSKDAPSEADLEEEFDGLVDFRQVATDELDCVKGKYFDPTTGLCRFDDDDSQHGFGNAGI